MPLIYLNGRFLEHLDAALDPLDRGVLLGDGLFETIRCEELHPLFLDQHYARLGRGARLVEIPFSPSCEELLAIAEQVLDANNIRCGRLRITLTRGESHGSPDIARSHTAPTLVVHASPLDAAEINAQRAQGWRARITHFPINHRSPLAQVKSTSYQEHVLARHWARREAFDEGLLLNTDGLLAEGAMSNLFIVKDGKVSTPPLDDGALAGVMREQVIRLCTQLNIGFAEESLAVEDLEGADEAFLTSSLIEVMPLVGLGRKSIGEGAPGPVTVRLQEEHRASVERFLSSIRTG